MFSKSGGKIKKVPGNDSEAFKSSLMGLLEKNRCRKFYLFVQKFDKNKQETYQKMPIKNMTFA